MISNWSTALNKYQNIPTYTHLIHMALSPRNILTFPPCLWCRSRLLEGLHEVFHVAALGLRLLMVHSRTTRSAIYTPDSLILNTGLIQIDGSSNLTRWFSTIKSECAHQIIWWIQALASNCDLILIYVKFYWANCLLYNYIIHTTWQLLGYIPLVVPWKR